MNILIVSPKFDPVIGGGETYVLNSARQLTAAGHKITVACSPHKDRVVSSYDFDIVEIKGLDDDQLSIYASVPKLYNLINALCPDVIHAHGYFALLAAGLAQPLPRRQTVLSVHSTPVWGERIFGTFKDFDAELAFARNTLALNKPSTLIVGSEAYEEAANKIVQHTIPIITLSYPVDTLFMATGNNALREELKISSEKVVIAIPSRILPRKGILEAICSLEHLPSNYVLCLPGAYEPLDQDYWRNIKTLPIWETVKGRLIIPKRRIGYNDLPNLYTMSAIIAMPSYYEGFGLAALESMAAGTPVIGTHVQGLQDLIEHNENGLLIPPKDPIALAAAIKLIIGSESLRTTIIEGGKRTADIHSWDRHLKRLTGLYNAT